MIAVKEGYADSLKEIQELYSDGKATKDDYTKVLESYQEYLSEIKSPQRDKAAATNANCPMKYANCHYYQCRVTVSIIDSCQGPKSEKAGCKNDINYPR